MRWPACQNSSNYRQMSKLEQQIRAVEDQMAAAAGRRDWVGANKAMTRLLHLQRQAQESPRKAT